MYGRCGIKMDILIIQLTLPRLWETLQVKWSKFFNRKKKTQHVKSNGGENYR